MGLAVTLDNILDPPGGMPDIGPVEPDMTLRPSTGPLLPFYPNWIYLTKNAAE